jgi:hypothetical protein
MIANLTIIDDFLHDPHGVRQFALAQDFSQVPEFDGHQYPGFVPIKDDRALGYLAERISEAIGGNVTMKLACVLKGTAAFSTQQWIHADNNCGNFAGVLYLFDRPGYGTAFWQHKETQTHGMRDLVALCDRAGLDPAAVATQLKAEGQTQDAWIRTDYVESRFNRLVVYPTDRFHSRWPEKAFGDEPENCRLTASLFFDLT